MAEPIPMTVETVAVATGVHPWGAADFVPLALEVHARGQWSELTYRVGPDDAPEPGDRLEVHVVASGGPREELVTGSLEALHLVAALVRRYGKARDDGGYRLVIPDAVLASLGRESPYVRTFAGIDGLEVIAE